MGYNGHFKSYCPLNWFVIIFNRDKYNMYNQIETLNIKKNGQNLWPTFLTFLLMANFGPIWTPIPLKLILR